MAVSELEHVGVVKEYTQGWVYVAVPTTKACLGCQAREMCHANSRGDERVIAVESFAQEFVVGDKVIVTLQEGAGMKAVFFAYVLPVVAIIVSLLLAKYFRVSDGVAGIICLIVAASYYLVLFWLREKLKKSFIFKVRPISPDEVA